MSQYPCSNCGANVEFAPGTSVLKCPYCGAETPLAPTGVRVREHAFAEFAGLPRKPVTALAANVFTCRGCGAVTQSDRISDRCQFCGAPLVADTTGGEMVAPEAVLPFGLDRDALREALRKWASSRWFAPNGLKKVTEAESSHSTYLPHCLDQWTALRSLMTLPPSPDREMGWPTSSTRTSSRQSSPNTELTAWANAETSCATMLAAVLALRSFTSGRRFGILQRWVRSFRYRLWVMSSATCAAMIEGCESATTRTLAWSWCRCGQTRCVEALFASQPET